MSDEGGLEAHIMSEVARGNVDAFRELFDLHHPGVLNLAYRFTGNRQDSEDITQKVFIKVFKVAGKYIPRAKFTTWLYRIARNECISFHRKRRRSTRPLEISLDSGEGGQIQVPAGDLPSKELQRKQRRAEIFQALSSLPPNQKLALELQRFHGLSYAEIADVLGRSIAAVESLLFRARKTLMKTLSGSRTFPEDQA